MECKIADRWSFHSSYHRISDGINFFLCLRRFVYLLLRHFRIIIFADLCLVALVQDKAL